MSITCARGGRFTALVTAIACVAASPVVTAADAPPVPLAERAAGAHTVVVARALSVEPRFQTNAHGDQLIVSTVLLQVEETLKGPAVETAWMEIEGGTLGGVTLRVSDLPEIRAGARAVFFFDPPRAGLHRPHRRGLGILELDRRDVVRGSSLHLDEVRRVVGGTRVSPQQ